jgi:hypothetical protein
MYRAVVPPYNRHEITRSFGGAADDDGVGSDGANGKDYLQIYILEIQTLNRTLEQEIHRNQQN